MVGIVTKLPFIIGSISYDCDPYRIRMEFHEQKKKRKEQIEHFVWLWRVKHIGSERM